jgi:RimJ/RimL family protein N-acetyltransferase
MALAQLETTRLRLIAATPQLIDAELEGVDRLGAHLGADVPADWPPEHHDAETLAFWREQLADPGAAGWWLYYALFNAETAPTLVGSVGYKGLPSNGVVEIGYSVVESWRRRGIATEACQALIEAAWARGAEVVLAHTFERLEPSIGVLRKLGFKLSENPEADELEFVLRRR